MTASVRLQLKLEGDVNLNFTARRYANTVTETVSKWLILVNCKYNQKQKLCVRHTHCQIVQDIYNLDILKLMGSAFGVTSDLGFLFI